MGSPTEPVEPDTAPDVKNDEVIEPGAQPTERPSDDDGSTTDHGEDD
jgi:hypothetical protein